MTQSGVLPFVRGIDFTKYNFEQEQPKLLDEMERLRWIKLNNTCLTQIPEQISQLKKLEQIHINRNRINELNDNLSNLECLKVLNARKNYLKEECISSSIWSNLNDLSVIDLSFNNLTQVPTNLEDAKTILVLNLSNNLIRTIPSQLFINLTDLVYLNLSHNKLDTLPPQLRRLIHLKTLILNNNELLCYQLRQIPSLISLQTLHLSNTQRNLSNIPSQLELLANNLIDIDLSMNSLPSVPDCIFKLKKLKRLNLSNNDLHEVYSLIDNLQDLQTLNLSRNKLKSLPSSLCKLSKLKKLYLNSNQLTFNGLPTGISKLNELELFSASDNLIETLPEGFCRCGKLKKLYLNKNRLITLPEAIHFLQLKELDVSDNVDFIMPAKPLEMQKGSGSFYYNVDFSLEHQLQLLSINNSNNNSSNNKVVTNKDATQAQTKSKDPVARKKRLKRIAQTLSKASGAYADDGEINDDDDDDMNSKLVLRGMRETRNSEYLRREAEEAAKELIKGKKWDEQLEKPKIDYSDYFDDDVGQVCGIICYEIENFVPNACEPALNGKFYEGDCYIILRTYIDDETLNLNWQIYFWIGRFASLDKQACAAMHAVNLRNLLGATCRTQREEQYDESEEFLDLFGTNLVYVEGARTSSGFYTVEDVDYQLRLYRIQGTHKLHMEPCEIHFKSLDNKYVYMLDNGLKIYLWNGIKCNPITKSKARLFAEKINKNERKFQAEIIQMKQGDEVPAFWRLLSSEQPSIDDLNDLLNNNNNNEHFVVDTLEENLRKPKLYKVGIGMGYLELPQVHLKPRETLRRELLDTKSVYILDCFNDIFVWIGRKSTRLVKTAACKLSSSLELMIKRNTQLSLVTTIIEGNETQVFKSKFDGWDDLIQVDYTRSAESVSKRGANLNKILLESELKTDLLALLLPRYKPQDDDEALEQMNDENDYLESMKGFIYENKKFIALSKDEEGEFYAQDSYLFVCKYWKYNESDDDDDDDDDANHNEQEDDIKSQQSLATTTTTTATTNDQLTELECKIYFWQGRLANNHGWLSFNFTLKKNFDKIEVIKLNQQQESPQFLSHFKRKFVIHNGKRSSQIELNRQTRMYHLRRNPHSAICIRCIEIEAKSDNLCSSFNYIVCVPFDNNNEEEINNGEKGEEEEEEEEDEEEQKLLNANNATIIIKGIVYVWLGSKSNRDEWRLAEEIANKMYLKLQQNNNYYTIQVINEGEEPETFFWLGLGGKRVYDLSADYMNYMRLFRCSNDRGYFAVTEKCIDFCQDDLSDDDIMILDNGVCVYLWVGPTSTEIEFKLAFKSAQVYIQHLKQIQSNESVRKLLPTTKGKEPLAFKKCFHAWSKHKNPPRNLEKKLVFRFASSD